MISHIMEEEYIYIMISRTNTFIGKLIRNTLKVEYNHCSLSFDPSLNHIYSFGRKKLYNVFVAGFVKESKNRGFFAMHDDANIILIRISVSYEEKIRMRNIIAKFEEDEEQYKYSLLGLVYCFLGISVKRNKKYFCSHFVAEVLQRAGVEMFDKPASLIRPHDFLKVPTAEYIYEGQIGLYNS